MKYIILAKDNEEYLVLFPDSQLMAHSDMTDAVQSVRVGSPQQWERKFRLSEVVAAGFVRPDLTCYGHSESLGISSRGDKDTMLLQKQLRG